MIGKRLGPLLWFLSIQYYVVQVLVALDWAKPYSLARNTISDLANTHCGLYGSKFVCSPLHGVMNTSFVVLAITMLLGALLIGKRLATNAVSALGFIFIALAGIGNLLVGLFPENTVSSLHILGAALTFVFGNVGMLILGLSLTQKIPKSVRLYTLFSGCVGLVALGLFMSRHYLGIGIGGMERFTAYPQSIWMTIFGIYLLVTSSRGKTTK